MSAFAVLALAVVIFLLSGVARADGPARVLIINQGSEELGRKLTAEAAHVGFVVIDSRPGAQTDVALLDKHRAVAIVRVVSPELVQLFISGAGAESPHLQDLRRQTSDGESFPVRVVEQLRARLVELKIVRPEDLARPPTVALPPAALPPATTATASVPTAPPTAAPPAPTTAAPPIAPPGPPSLPPPMGPVGAPSGPGFDGGAVIPGADRAPRLWLNAGLAAVSARGGMGPAVHGALGLRLESMTGWGGSLIALLPFSEHGVDAEAGGADGRATILGGHVDYSSNSDNPWVVDGGLGAGLLVLALRGEAFEGFDPQDERLLSGLYYAHLGGARSLSSGFRLKASLYGGVSAPRPVARIVNRNEATWGRLFAVAILSVELGIGQTAGGPR